MLTPTRLTASLLVLLAAGACCLFGQVVGAALSGIVHDESGSPIAGVSVVVRNTETGAERKLVTDEGGRYGAPSIPVGAYEVTASKPGFSSQTRTGLNLVVGQTATVDLVLPVGQVNQVVTVQESVPPVSVSTQQTSGLVSEKQVKDLPLNGRSYDELMALNPAIVNYTSERSGGIGL